MSEEMQQLTSYLLNIEELRKARLEDADVIERLKKERDALEAALRNVVGNKIPTAKPCNCSMCVAVAEGQEVLAAIEKERNL